MPGYDNSTFVVPIEDTGVEPKMNFQENLNYFL